LKLSDKIAELKEVTELLFSMNKDYAANILTAKLQVLYGEEKRRETNDLMKMPLGTRFYVEKGNWHGKICGTENERMIYVEETDRTYPLTADHGLRVTRVADENTGY
jgi:hypothetical protein